MAARVSFGHNRAVSRLAVILIALLLIAGSAGTAAAAEPDPACNEVHPSTGPGGLDLALLCTLDRVRNAYGEAAANGALVVPPGVIAAIAIGGLLVSLALRVLATRTRRRLAPAATPAAWWVCSGCRSFNAPDASRCYACHAVRTLDAALAPTTAVPTMDQRFGRPDV
jgi:hypothetical protein